MRKKLLFPFLVLLFIVAIQDQLSAQTEFGASYGLTLNSAQIKGVNDDFLPEVTEFVGNTAGLDLAFRMDEHFSFVTGLYWEERGMDSRYDWDIDFLGLEVPVGLKIRTRIHYLEMPLAMKVKFANKKKVHPFFAGGVKLGLALDGNIAVLGQVVVDIKITEIPINLASDNARQFDLSPFMMTGLDIPYKCGVFTFGLAYEYSAFNFLKESTIAIEFRHYGFSTTLGYRYKFGCKKEVKVDPDRV